MADSNAGSLSQADPSASLQGASSDLERVIRIIMDATGYERHEIEPDMDIRQDLAIRSSRLPVIMDMAEREFGITITIENFIGLRTVREVAARISELARDPRRRRPSEPSAGLEPPAVFAEPSPRPSATERPLPRAPLKRLVFEQVPLGRGAVKRLKIEAGSEVAVLAPGESGLAEEVAGLIKARLGARPVRLNPGSGFDLNTRAGTEAAVRWIGESKSLAGLVVTMDEEVSLSDMTKVPALLTGLFRCLQALMHSPERAFCLFIRRNLDASSPGAVAAEGLEGMLLSAALEYSSVLFRSVALDADTELSAALEQALDTSMDPVGITFRSQAPFTLAAKVRPIPLRNESSLKIDAGDVIVISGGGRGITSRLALALAPFQPKLVLLGRSRLNPEVDYEALKEADGPVDESVRAMLKRTRPEMKEEEVEAETCRILAGVEITETLADLRRLGVEASYHSCDVTDQNQVSQVLDQVVKRFGRIDGVIHGAGVVRDGFMELMSPGDFSRVVEVKILGGWNLYLHSYQHGLRFIVGLSSVAAATGNVGQVNYGAANRALAAFLSGFPTRNRGVLVKALILPPVEGAGMADTEEMKELLEIKGLGGAYIHLAELAGLFCRELLLGPPADGWAMWARALPRVKTVRVDLQEPGVRDRIQPSGGVSFEKRDLPMIQVCHRLDIERGELEASRTFSQRHDLWLDDHRPLKSMRNPLLSGVMAVEAFLEAAHLLHPHLSCRGVRRVRYRDFLEVPEHGDREVKIVCRSEVRPGEVLCEVSLSSQEISPSGRPLDRWYPNFDGQVVLGPGHRNMIRWSDLGVVRERFDKKPMDPDKVRDYYEKRSGLRGRYRVIGSIHGSSPDAIRGIMIYRKSEDFEGMEDAGYHYSPYLLEAFMHLANFFVSGRTEEETRLLIPVGIRELRFGRLCQPGETITLEARLRSSEADGSSWDARGLDEEGKTLMEVEGLDMKWSRE